MKADVFDKHYTLTEVDESIVVKDPSDGGGGLIMQGINDSKEFNYETKEIYWNDKIKLPKEDMEFYKKIYDIDLT